MKTQKALLAATVAAALGLPAMAAEPLRMVVEAKPGKLDSIKAQLAAKGIHIKRELAHFDTLAISLDKTQLQDAASIKGINAFYPDVARKPMADSAEFIPHGIHLVQADQLSYQGGQKVCIIDSGYPLGHPDLPDTHVDGADDGGAGPWYEDPFGHGAHVAGTIAALGGNDMGVVGVNPDGNLDLHIVRVFNGRGEYAYGSDIAAAVDECVQADASIISMSLGGIFSSSVEEKAMEKVHRSGVLLVAAAGNSANATHAYPASYDSVMSVAAVDSTRDHAAFSQRTSQVEVAAPGVNTLSTTPLGRREVDLASVSQGNHHFDGYGTQGTSLGEVTGILADCGLGTDSCGDMSGKICLIERGQIPFGEKVAQCEADGGIGAIIYNNQPGPLPGQFTLGYDSPIVSASLAQSEGRQLLADAGQETTLAVAHFDSHMFASGTSMATPHVSGVAALVWSHFPECSAAGIRLALRESALDLGDSGYDYQTGWGLVQAKAAYDHIKVQGCHVAKGKIRGGNGAAH